METVKIKLLGNPENAKLKMKYVGSLEYATPKEGKDGKTITGIDETSYDILSIPDDTSRKKAISDMKKIREDLEKLLGQELHPGAAFWDKFFVVLSDEEITLNLTNPLDRIKEKFLVANHYVAPSEETIDTDEAYHNCIFYLYREKEEAARAAKKNQKEDKAKGLLYAESQKAPAAIKILASYILGGNLDDDASPETCYNKLKEFITNTDEKIQRKNIDVFLKAVETKPEEMTIKLILDKAIKKRIVLVKRSVHRYNDEVIGGNYDETLVNLASPEYSSTLSGIKKEVENSSK